MRILKLTARLEKWLLARRAQQDRKAQAVAAEIVADVRKRGDAALFAYARKFDSTDLDETGVWIAKKEISVARKRVSREYLKAVEKADKNVRIVVEKQLPQPWVVETT